MDFRPFIEKRKDELIGDLQGCIRIPSFYREDDSGYPYGKSVQECLEYTLKLAEKWKAPTAECSKGLAEGFVKPEPTYSFDHSHAWGGTPLYSVPLALTGLEVLEPGMKTIRLNPTLLGLAHARVELPTAWGDVVCELEEGKAPVITHPAEVKVYLA